MDSYLESFFWFLERKMALYFWMKSVHSSLLGPSLALFGAMGDVLEHPGLVIWSLGSGNGPPTVPKANGEAVMAVAGQCRVRSFHATFLQIRIHSLFRCTQTPHSFCVGSVDQGIFLDVLKLQGRRWVLWIQAFMEEEKITCWLKSFQKIVKDWFFFDPKRFSKISTGSIFVLYLIWNGSGPRIKQQSSANSKL